MTYLAKCVMLCSNYLTPQSILIKKGTNSELRIPINTMLCNDRR